MSLRAQGLSAAIQGLVDFSRLESMVKDLHPNNSEARELALSAIEAAVAGSNAAGGSERTDAVEILSQTLVHCRPKFPGESVLLMVTLHQMSGHSRWLMDAFELALEHRLYELAIQLLDVVSQIDTTDSVVRFCARASAELLETKLLKPLEAADRYRQAADRFTDSLTWRLEMLAGAARCLEVAEAYAELRDVTTAQLELETNSRNLAVLHTRLANLLENPSDAAEHYRRALTHAPSFETPFHGLLAILSRENDWEGALEVLQEKIKHENRRALQASILTRMGEIAGRQLHDLQRAHQYLHHALQLSADALSARVLLAELLLEAGQAERAERVADISQSHHSRHPNSLQVAQLCFVRAKITRQLGWSAEAVRCQVLGLELQPEPSEDALRQLVDMVRVDRPALDGLESFERLILTWRKDKPEFTSMALVARGLMHVCAGQLESALAQLKEAYALQPQPLQACALFDALGSVSQEQALTFAESTLAVTPWPQLLLAAARWLDVRCRKAEHALRLIETHGGLASGGELLDLAMQLACRVSDEAAAERISESARQRPELEEGERARLDYERLRRFSPNHPDRLALMPAALQAGSAAAFADTAPAQLPEALLFAPKKERTRWLGSALRRLHHVGDKKGERECIARARNEDTPLPFSALEFLEREEPRLAARTAFEQLRRAPFSVESWDAWQTFATDMGMLDACAAFLRGEPSPVGQPALSLLGLPPLPQGEQNHPSTQVTLLREAVPLQKRSPKVFDALSDSFQKRMPHILVHAAVGNEPRVLTNPVCIVLSEDLLKTDISYSAVVYAVVRAHFLVEPVQPKIHLSNADTETTRSERIRPEANSFPVIDLGLNPLHRSIEQALVLFPDLPAALISLSLNPLPKGWARACRAQWLRVVGGQPGASEVMRYAFDRSTPHPRNPR